MESIPTVERPVNIARVFDTHGYELLPIPGFTEEQDCFDSLEDAILETITRKLEDDEVGYLFGISVTLYENKVDYGYLVKKAIKHGVQNQLGYLLDMTLHLCQDNCLNISQDELIRKTVNILLQERNTTPQYICKNWENNQGFRKLSDFRKQKYQLKEKWGVIDISNYEDYKKKFDLYVTGKIL